MTEIIKMRSPSDGTGKDPNDTRDNPKYRHYLEQEVVGAKNSRGPVGLFPFIYTSDIDVEEQVEFRIDAWIEEHGINVLYAPKDCYKSFLAVDWFMCVASGKPWCGFETKQGAGVYIAGEGNSGLKRRIKAWCIRNKFDLNKMDIALSKFPMQVLDLSSIKEWAEHIMRVQDHIGKPIEFVIIDTLATNFGPGDENSSTDMARFIAYLKIYIQAVFNCTIVVVHHTGKDAEKGARGGYSLEANADAVYELKRPKDSGNDSVLLRCKHIKDSEAPPDLTLSKEVVELGFNDRNGHPVTSLVLKMSLAETEQAILNQSNAGKGQRSIAENVGVSKTTVSRTQSRLRKLGLLKEAGK